MSAEPGKRSFVNMLTAYAILTLIVVSTSLIARVRAPAASPTPVSSEDPVPNEVLAYLGALAEGTSFEGHKIVRIEPPRRGRLTLEIVNAAGEHFVIDLHARGSGPPPPAESTALAVFVRSKPGESSASAATACAALATELRKREAAGAKPPGLAVHGAASR